MTKVIAIFGAGTGLGMSVARRFGHEGYRVALISRSATTLDGFVSELAAEGIKAAAFPANLIDTGAVPALIGAIRARFGRIDVVVYGPTTTATGFTPASELTAEGLQDRLALFLLTPIEIVQAVLPDMLSRGDGAIVATHGIAAVQALPDLSGPGTVTAATRNYLHCLNAELSDKGIFAGNLVVGGYIARGKRYGAGSDSDAAKSKTLNGMVIPVFDPDDLAQTYWDMTVKRNRPEVMPPAPA